MKESGKCSHCFNYQFLFMVNYLLFQMQTGFSYTRKTHQKKEYLHIYWHTPEHYRTIIAVTSYFLFEYPVPDVHPNS